MGAALGNEPARELPARPDAELRVRVRQVGLDGVYADEQGLRDLLVGRAARRQLDTRRSAGVSSLAPLGCRLPTRSSSARAPIRRALLFEGLGGLLERPSRRGSLLQSLLGPAEMPPVPQAGS